jgi:hypothetical protein
MFDLRQVGYRSFLLLDYCLVALPAKLLFAPVTDISLNVSGSSNLTC